MASLLKLDHSTYVRYERPDRYKKRFLPIELARRIAAILADYGVDPVDVMALAGLESDEVEPTNVTAGESAMLDEWRSLDPEEQHYLRGLMRKLRGQRPAPTTTHSGEETDGSRQKAAAT